MSDSTGRAHLFVSDSGGGTLYGRLLNHRCALAATERIADRVPLEQHTAPLRQVAEYARGAERIPYRVVHDTTVNRPYGRYAVYVGPRRIGAQLSVPSVADCERMENPPPPAAALEHRLSKGARMALGLGTPSEKAAKVAAERAWRHRRTAHQRVMGKK